MHGCIDHRPFKMGTCSFLRILNKYENVSTVLVVVQEKAGETNNAEHTWWLVVLCDEQSETVQNFDKKWSIVPYIKLTVIGR